VPEGQERLRFCLVIIRPKKSEVLLIVKYFCIFVNYGKYHFSKIVTFNIPQIIFKGKLESEVLAL
jgi:hypothetical protein